MNEQKMWNVLTGIDVDRHNGNIDWQKVKARHLGRQLERLTSAD